MHAQNKIFIKLLKTSMVLSVASLVGACSSGGSSFSSNSPSLRSGETMTMGSAAEAALCQNKPGRALAILSAEPFSSPTDKFFMAVALEKSGHANRARQTYASVMQSGSNDNVSLRCGNETIAMGAVTSEAGKRLANISRHLALLDVNMHPRPPLHRGLASMSRPVALPPVRSSSGTRKPNQAPVTTLAAPRNQDPFGDWFVHLASYRSIDNATKSLPVLERKYPALAGNIDQWQVNSSGTAIRLGLRLNNKSEADSICAAIKQSSNYCAVLNTRK